jgi:CheY-like chemotaxis protein
MKILIVDDDQFSVELLTHYLEPLGFAIQSVQTLAEAFEKMREIPPPNIVFLDLILPDSVHETKTLAQVRSLCALNPDVVIIIVSGMSVKELGEMAALAGAHGFMEKTGDADQAMGLYRTMLKAIGTRHPSQETDQMWGGFMEKLTAVLPKMAA